MSNWTEEWLLQSGRDAEGRLRTVPAVALGKATVAVGKPQGDCRRLSADARSRLKSEQRLQVEMCEAVRPRLVPGARWCATNIEMPGASKLFALFQTIRTAMGAEAGFPDVVVLWPRRNIGFVEVKRGRGEPDLLGHRKARGELSGAQREFRDWCDEWGYLWCSPRSVEEALRYLLAWGAIRAP
jgi:hypothetical protein